MWLMVSVISVVRSRVEKKLKMKLASAIVPGCGVAAFSRVARLKLCGWLVTSLQEEGEEVLKTTLKDQFS